MRTYRKEQLRICKVASVAAMLSKKLQGIMLLIGTTSEDNWRKKKQLIKTMKRIRYERHDKENKNDIS